MADKVEDFTNYLYEQRRMSAVGQVLDAYHGEENKDQAAHSIKLGQVFNENPEPIYHDYDHFVADKQATLASDLLNKNRYLQDYVNYHPLAAVVSQDDWTRLDELTKILNEPTHSGTQLWDWSKHLPSDIWDTFTEGLKGVRDAFHRGTLEKMGEPVAPSLAKGYSPELQAKLQERLKYTTEPSPLFNVMFGLLQAKYAIPLGAAKTFITRPIAETTGLPQETVDQAALLALSAFGIKGEVAKVGKAERAEEIEKAYRAAKAQVETVKPFAKAGEDPPKGINPDVDKAIAEASKVEHEQAANEEKAAKATETKEAAPELIEKLVSDIRRGQEIEVSWDAVKKMYGDKVPEPGDKMLGDVPDIQRQWADSETNGKPIVMTKGHWIGKVNPDVWKELKDDYRDRPESMTKNEIKSLEELEELSKRVKEEKEPKEPKEKTLIENIRTQAGLDAIIERGAVMGKKVQDKFSRLKKRIDEANETKELQDKLKEAKKKLTPEWKANRVKVREEVAGDIDNHPAFGLNEMLQYGTHKGQDVGKVRIDPETLWPYQREAIPDRLFSKEEGLHPDQLGKIFGFQSGHEAMESLTQFYKEKGNLGAKAYREKVIERETDRRMEQRYGKLDDLILQEAREHVIGQQSQFDWLHEEVVRLATILKQEGPLSKADFRAQAWQKFNTSQASAADLKRSVKYLGEAGKLAEAAYLKDDLKEAYRQRQYQTQLLAEAQLISTFQRKVMKPLNRMVKTYHAAEVAGVPQEFLNHIQNILARVGKPSVRTPENIQAAIAEQEHKTFVEFAQAHNETSLPQGFEQFGVDYNPNIVVTDFLLNPDWHGNFDKMTVGEARAVHASLASLIKMGRGENTVTIRGKQKDFNTLKEEGIIELSKQGDKPKLDNNKALDNLKQLLQSTNIGLQQIEHWFSMLDFWDPRGFFSQNFFYPMIEAANSLDAGRRKYAIKLKALEKYKEVLNKSVTNDLFMDQTYRNTLTDEASKVPIKMNRTHLRGVLLNVGNESNLRALSEGYRVTPKEVMEWAHREATEEDWKWAEEAGKIFSDLQRESDLMTMRMNGSVIDKIQLGSIKYIKKNVETGAAEVGRLDGWYFPLRYDRTQGGGHKESILNKPAYIRIMTDHGWENKRTGYIGPVRLGLEDLGQQIDRRLRDIHLREAVTEVSKFFQHEDVKTAIGRYQGPQYAEMPIKWLKDITGQHAYNAGSLQGVADLGDFIRVNIVSTLVGWNPGTIVKHNLSAYAQSIREVGVIPFLRAMGDLYQTDKETMMKNWQFAMENSLELQRRQQHWMETLGGALELQLGKSSWRAKSLQFNSLPMAITDGWGSKVTWLAKYRSVMEENTRKGIIGDEAHEDAVTLADRAVRNSHGSTSIASKPEFMRIQGPIMQGLVSLYGFYNHVYQRYNKMYNMSKMLRQEGAPKGQYIGSIGLDLLAYAAIPIAVHAWLDGHDKDSWYKRIGEGAFSVGFGTLPVVRDIAHGLVHGAAKGHFDIGQFGIFSAGGKILGNVLSDMSPSHWDKHHMGSMVEHAMAMAAMSSGLGNQQFGRWSKYVTNLLSDEDKLPQDFWQGGRALRWGSSRTLEENRKLQSRLRRRH